MSYSFYDVLPYMLVNSGRDLLFNMPLFKDIGEADELYDAFDGITSEVEDETFVFNIPAFTGNHYETNQVRTFEAKTFTITVVDFDSNMDGYEGKVNTHYYTDLIDRSSGEKMDLSYYYDSNYSLREVEVSPAKKIARNK